MGFLMMGGSCLCQSPFYQSLPCSSFLSTSHRKHSKKKMATIACMNHENQNETKFITRKAFLLVGLSALPFLQSSATAFEALVKDKEDVAKAEEPSRNEASTNPFVGFLNGIGIVGLGVLGALYASAKKEMTTLESTIESMKRKLSDKETAMASMERNFKLTLQSEQEKWTEQMKRLKEEQTSLSDQLAAGKNSLTLLEKELQNEKILSQDLKAEIGHFQSVIAQAGEDKKALEVVVQEKEEAVNILQERISLLSLEIKDKETCIEKLKTALAEMESECKNLTELCEQTKEDLKNSNSVVRSLEEVVQKTREELELKSSLEVDLNAKIKSLFAEKDEINKRAHALLEEYNDFKSAAAERAASDSELLSRKDHELNQLKRKLDIALDEARSNELLIAELTRERDNLTTMFENEVKTLKNVRGELQITTEALETSKLEIADLSKQLKESKRSCEELTSEISRIQAEFSLAQETLNQHVDEVKSNSKLLSVELLSVKEALSKTEQELLLTTNELKDMTRARDNLKKELLEIHPKTETITHDLKEEKKVVASLNNELKELRKQIDEDKDARRNLERDLEEATKSLDEMNKSALLLSKELEESNAKSAGLETEKDMLYQSLAEQKDVAKEARENLEDAHNLLTKLGEERDTLGKKNKKLEEDLASAKGEILRLRREINLDTRTVTEEDQSKNEEAEDGEPVVVKRGGRRTKRASTS